MHTLSFFKGEYLYIWFSRSSFSLFCFLSFCLRDLPFGQVQTFKILGAMAGRETKKENKGAVCFRNEKVQKVRQTETKGKT